MSCLFVSCETVLVGIVFGKDVRSKKRIIYVSYETFFIAHRYMNLSRFIPIQISYRKFKNYGKT